jgi:hypothetical protein
MAEAFERMENAEYAAKEAFRDIDANAPSHLTTALADSEQQYRSFMNARLSKAQRELKKAQRDLGVGNVTRTMPDSSHRHRLIR